MEATSGFGPLNGSFADSCLTTWLRRPLNVDVLTIVAKNSLRCNRSDDKQLPVYIIKKIQILELLPDSLEITANHDQLKSRRTFNNYALVRETFGYRVSARDDMRWIRTVLLAFG